MHLNPHLTRSILAAALMLSAVAVKGQGVFSVPGSPGWTQQFVRETRDGAQLLLTVMPTVEGTALRKGFYITVHQDNAPWSSLEHTGRKPLDFILPSGHLYTIEVTHAAAYKKVIQFDTQEMDQPIQLECGIDLMLRPDLEKLTFEDQLILSMPLSVVWYDPKRNLFRHDAYLHGDGIERLRSHLSLRDPSLHDAP